MNRPSWVILLAVVIVASCESSATPSATQTSPSQTPLSATPAASPALATATPFDAREVLVGKLSRGSFTAWVTIKGTETIPSGVWAVDEAGSPDPLGSSLPVILEYEGQAYVRGRDHLVRLQVGDPPNLVLWELRRGDQTRRRTFTHPWQEMPSSGDIAGPRLFDILAATTVLEPLEPSADATGLLRFTVPAQPLDLVKIWLQETAENEPDAGTVEIRSQPDGIPVSVQVHLDSDDFDYSGVLPESITVPPREYDFEYQLSGVGDSIQLPALDAPAKPYAWPGTDLDLEIPLLWEERSEAETWDGGGGIEVGGPGPTDGRLVVVLLMRWLLTPKGGATVEQTFESFAAWAVDDLRSTQGMELLSLEQLEILGRSAYLAALRAEPTSGDSWLHQEALFTDGITLYAIQRASPMETELVGRYEFEQMLASLQVGD